MTYRKLFRHILTASTVVLLVVWVGSLFYSASVARTPVRFMIVHGTLESAFTQPSPESVNDDIIFTETLNGGLQKLPDRGMDHPLGRWKVAREEEHLFGGTSGSTPPDLYIHTLHVPLWALWLAVVGCGFLFCRVMERRSLSGREKEMAKGQVDWR